MELKLAQIYVVSEVQHQLLIEPSMELKPQTNLRKSATSKSFNRTSMELKPTFRECLDVP